MSLYIEYMLTQEWYMLFYVMTTSSCYASEGKTLWGKPDRVHRISDVDIEDECTV